AGAILDGGDFAVDIVADGGTTTLAAGTSIGTAAIGLETTIDRLTATASAGDVHIDETNGLSAVSVSAAGAGNDVDISSTTGDILVGVITAPDTITLTAVDGGIEELAGGEEDTDSDFVAITLDLDATAGIGDDATIEITATSIAVDSTNNNIDLLNQNSGAGVTATSLTTGTGTIDFVQTDNEALTVTLAQTTNGTITIQNTGDADAVTLTLTSVTAGGIGDVNATTLTAGDVLVGSVTADANTVTITSAGAINDSTADTTIDITVGTGTIDMNAVDGIGNTAALELVGTSISADTSTGAIDLDNVLATDVTVTSLTTVGTMITFDQSGGGNVSFDGTVSSGDAGTVGDDILLTAANGDLTINAAIESRSANVTATSTENIVVTAGGGIISVGGNVVLNSDTDTAISAGGGIRILGTVTSAGGNITLGGGADPATTNTVATATSGNDGIQIDGGTLDAAAGDISLRGSSTLDDGIGIQDGTIIQTTSGSIAFNGTSATGNDGIEITGTSTTVTSATGSISVVGVGSAGDGVDVSSDAVVSSTGTATITIGGTSTAVDQAGVRLQDTNTQIASVDGNVSITGTNNSNLGVFVTSGVEVSSTGTGASAATISITGTGDAGIDVDTAGTLVTSVDGDILLDGNANTLEGIMIADATISSTGTTADAATITLDGSSNGAVSVQLNNGSMATSVAGNIQFTGDSSAATTNGIELQSGSSVSSTGNGAVVASITMMGTGGTANDGIHIDGSIESVNGNIQLTGVTSDADGDDGVDLDAGTIESTGTGTIQLVGNGQTNGLEIQSSITSNSGTITLQSADDTIEFEFFGNLTSTSGNVTITADMTAGGAAGQFLMADGSDVLAGTGMIDIDAEGDITIGLLQTIDASNIAVTIDTATGAVIDAGNASTLSIDATAGRAVINAVTGVGSADALETNLASLDVDNSTSGDIKIAETDAVTIFDAQQATAGNIIFTAGGTLTVDDGDAVTNAVSTAGDGTISLSATGIDSSLVINDGILSVTGDITATADNDVSIAADGDISSTSGNVTVTADSDGAVDSGGTDQGSLTMADGAVISAGSATIDLNANEDVTLGQLVTTNATTSAVQITSNVGGVVDGGDTGGPDIVSASGRTVIDAATGIGAADPLETSVESIEADTLVGTVDIDNSLVSTTTVISLTTVGGTVNFDQTGGGNLSVTGDVTSGSVGPDVDGGNIELTSTADLTVAGTANISSSTGAGGLLSINETTVDASAVISVGAGDVTLNGSGQDTIINATITTSTTATFTATRDVIVGATITITNADADIIINANTNDGVAVGAGGVQIQTAGQLVAGRDVTLTGSDLFVTNGAGVLDSIEVQNDDATDQIIANRDISLTSRVASPAGADILVLGELLAATRSINIDALDRTVLNDNADAGTDVTFLDAVDVSADLTVTAGNDVTFLSTVDELATATGSDLIVNGDGVTRFSAEVGGTSSLESLTTNAAGSTELDANVTADNGAITFDDSVLLTGNVTVTNTSATSINFNNTIDSQVDEHNNLVLTAATGEVVSDGDIGASLGAGADDLTLGSLTVTSAVGVTFGNNDGVTSVMADGSIDIGSATTIGASGITFDGVATGTTIETTSDTVRFNGAVTLNTDLRIDTDETASAATGGANVTFTNDTPINSQATEGNDLMIDAGIAQVFFNEDIGNAAADTELGLVVIEEATGGVTFGNADTETPGTGASGPVNVISLVGDGASTALDIGSVTTTELTSIVFNGGPGV
ncbi:MAG: beta strand repeat-containing protein, partial [Planctomycetales bacterium]